MRLFKFTLKSDFKSCHKGPKNLRFTKKYLKFLVKLCDFVASWPKSGFLKHLFRKTIPWSGIAFLLLISPLCADEAESLSGNFPENGALFGKIVDAESGEGLGWTQLLIEELNRSLSAHGDGSFHFFNLPPGGYTLKAFRVGYRDGAFRVLVAPGDTSEVLIRLSPSPVASQEVRVEALRSEGLSEIAQPELDISGKKLRQNLGRTIAETIDYEPGISQRTLGPAPARPVLRGLGGDRLLIVEDGERTGDLSATSSDHAVVIEPLTSERIEVIRGPEAFLYGSNTLGGVINVERGYVPAGLAHRVTGTLSLQGETVNRGYSGGASLAAPLGSFALRIDGSYRDAEDISTPQGALPNTAINTLNGSAGLSFVSSRGYIGAAGSYYESEYGIPPDPLAGHPGGVRVEVDRRHVEEKAEFYPAAKWLRRMELRHSFTRYRHSEIEYSERLQREIAGTGFDVLTHHLSGAARLNQSGLLRHGVIGVWGEFRDHSTPAGRNLTPRSREYSGAAYVYQEAYFGKFALNGALRFDAKQVDPLENVGRNTEAGLVRQRQFAGFSGSVSGLYKLNGVFSLGATLLRTLRAPGIEELFSEGPHLAVYTYEIGNADLGLEQGWGTEVFVKVSHTRGKFHLAAFRNDIGNYIFPENTGERSGRIFSLYEYRFTGQNALMAGIEAALEWQLFNHWYAGGAFSYVRGELSERNEPLPRIPPPEGRLSLRYQTGPISAGGGIRAAAEQNRCGEFEQPTAGYVVFDLSGQYNFSTGGVLHTFSLAIDNLLDTEYRKHLNWVKHIMPEPGRNVKFLYKIFF